MGFLSRRFRWLGAFWRLLSEADTLISVFGWGSVAVSALGAAVIAAVAYFQQAPWPALVVLFLFAFGALLWIAFQIIKILEWKKNKDKAELRDRYLNPNLIGEKEILDFLADGEEAMNDVISILTRASKETTAIGRKVRFYTLKLKISKSSKRRRDIVSLVSNEMIVYAGKLEEHAKFMGKINPIIAMSYKNYIMKCKVLTNEEVEGMRKLIETLESTSKTIIPNTVKMLHTYRRSVRDLTGISRDLSGASHRLVSVIGSFIGKVKQYGRTCDQLRIVAEQKMPRAGI